MRVLIFSVVVLALGANQAAASWSLGANLGITVISFDEVDGDYWLIGGPSQGFLSILGPPGLRVGIAAKDSPHEVFFDTGFVRASFNEGSLSVIQISGNYQYNFGNRSTHPYLTAGAGLSRMSDDNFLFSDDSETAPTFGAGFGVRHRLHHGYGTMRAEIRYDHLVADDDQTFFQDGDAFGLKLGFDVWGN